MVRHPESPDVIRYRKMPARVREERMRPRSGMDRRRSKTISACDRHDRRVRTCPSTSLAAKEPPYRR